MNPKEIHQLTAYSKQSGMIMGLVWVLSFACFVASLKDQSLTLIFDLTIISIPICGVKLIKHYRDKILNGTISFIKAFAYSMTMFVHAIIILSFAQWLYMEFLDNGFLFSALTAKVQSPEYKPLLDAYGVSMEETTTQLKAMADTRPIDFPFMFLLTNIFLSLILSWVIALITKKTKKNY